MILALHHAQITIPKEAEDPARAFYCGLLGFKEVPKPESLTGRGGFWLAAGDRQLHIGVEDNVDRSRTKAHVAFLVDDLASMKTLLTKSGIELIEGIPIPGYLRFEFRDPFGNRVEFLQTI